jgi:DNA-binding helix-hairpin-helix protein with protein kinase domain
MQNIPKLCDAQGNSIRLGQQLGRGGEGAVYEVQGQPDKVAKIYHKPVDSKQAAKLDGMVGAKTPQLVKVAAWPTDILRDKSRGAVKGLIMPKVQNYREIHHLYGPAHRKRDFPTADWAFLIHAARNVASVFEIIHSHGHVIGDVNQGNILVAADATCKLIDCDSFQVVSGGQIYSCDVGVPQFTPPELQNKTFHGITRTQNHDNFGLALICFHLLFMGRHPFSGRYSGPEDMPIEKAIQEFRFAYGTSAASKKMAPPPNVLGLDTITDQLKNLLERAFNQGSIQPTSRPTPKEWVQELDTLKNGLRSCSQNPIHKYSGNLQSCPWCSLEQSSGVLYFLSSISRVVGDIFDINRAWAKIQAIQLPTKIGFPAQVPKNFTPAPLNPLPSFPPLPALPTLSSFPALPPLPSFPPLPALPTLASFPPLPPSPSFPILPVLPTLSSFPLLLALPTLSSFGPLPPSPSFPPLSVILPSNDLPAAIPSVSQKSQVNRICRRIGKTRWGLLLILIVLSIFLKNVSILVGFLVYFFVCIILVKNELNRRQHALAKIELYAQEKVVNRNFALDKIRLDLNTEIERRQKIITEHTNTIIERRQKAIDRAKLDADAEIECRRGIIAEAKVKADAEIERRQKIIDKAKLDADAEIDRRLGIIAEAKAKADAEIERRQKIIDKAKLDANAEINRRQEVINQSKAKANAEIESRKKAIDQSKKCANTEIIRRQKFLASIRGEWQKSQDDWKAAAWNKAFYKKLQELQQIQQQWYALKARYDSEKSQAILPAYLSSFLLQDAKIDGIYEKLIMDLRSWGIETAADISETKVRQVNGFGPKRTEKLIDWKNDLETQFHRLPQSAKNIPTPQLDQKYAQQSLHLERSLRSGPEELQNIKKQIEQQQSQFLNRCRQLAQKLAQAEADALVQPS